MIRELRLMFVALAQGWPGLAFLALIVCTAYLLGGPR